MKPVRRESWQQGGEKAGREEDRGALFCGGWWGWAPVHHTRVREPTNVGGRDGESFSVHHWEGAVPGTSWEHSSNIFRSPTATMPTSSSDYFHKNQHIRVIIQLHECLGCYGNYKIQVSESLSIESIFQSFFKWNV